MSASHIILTPRLLLRPWFESDAPILYEYAKDPEVGPAAGWQVHTDVENSRQIIRDILSAPETYAVVLRENARPVGSVGIALCGNDKRFPPTEAEVGCWIGRPLWGQGLIPEAIEALLDRCFLQLNCTAVWYSWFDFNDKSRRVAEKCGFTYHHTEDIEPNPLNGATHLLFARQTREAWAARRASSGITVPESTALAQGADAGIEAEHRHSASESKESDA